uniref:Ig-like domain-containing protein n=1 Tax=Latimeria chalumnae TaxID=7897 RepID=H3BCS4_LATCH
MRRLQGFCCCFLLWLTCVQSQTVDLKPAFLSVNPGQAVTLDCNVEVKDSHSTEFYKEIPGEVPELVVAHYHGWSSPRYGPGFSSSRFSATVNSAGTQYQLTIRNTEARDTAMYYCGKWFTASSSYIHCKSSKLVVSAQEFPSPSVLVLRPSEEELTSKGTATLSCLISKLSIGMTEVTWMANGNSISSGISTGLASKDSDNTYSLSSYLKVPMADWNGGKIYSCQVQQGGAQSATTKEIQKSDC